MTYSETDLDSIPVGYRFHPTDEELFCYYLKLKMQGDKDYEVRAIREVNICKHEPWDLPGTHLSYWPKCQKLIFFTQLVAIHSVLAKLNSISHSIFNLRIALNVFHQSLRFCNELKVLSLVHGFAGLSVVKSDDQEWFFFCAREINRSRANRATKRGYWKSTGRDRQIRAKRTNTVIGTKKTLVFHEGRVPTGVRTSWLIHEYQPVAFHHHEVNLHVMFLSIFSLIAVSLWMKIVAVEFMNSY